MYVLKLYSDDNNNCYLKFRKENCSFERTTVLEDATRFEDTSEQCSFILNLARKTLSNYKVSAVTISERVFLNPKINIFEEYTGDEITPELQHFLLYGSMPSDK